MKKIGSWWLASIKAIKNEEIELSYLGNRNQSRNRAVGGKLFITNMRCVFLPHWFDFISGGKRMEFPLTELESVDVEPKGGDKFGGGLRDRLKLTHKNGHELFVVNKLEAVIESINSKIIKQT